jgi:hypothetical protein
LLAARQGPGPQSCYRKNQANQNVDSEDEEENDDDYIDKQEEDIPLDLDDDEEEEEEDKDVAVVEEATMSPKGAMAKKAAKKTKDELQELTERTSDMTVSAPSYWSFSMDFECPFIIKHCMFNEGRMCTIDLFIPTIHNSDVFIQVRDNGEVLAVTLAVPRFFIEQERCWARTLKTLVVSLLENYD